MEEGWIAHAALDVLETEPPGNNNPLLKMHNVTLSPHNASASARFDLARKRHVGARAGAGTVRPLANELRQPVRAGPQQPAPLAAGVHGTRPEQLTRS